MDEDASIIEGLKFISKTNDHFIGCEENEIKENKKEDKVGVTVDSTRDDIPAKPAEIDKEHDLTLAGASYMVREWQGSWWKGCCCRPHHQKQVLQDIIMTMRSTQLTAILGNSGSGKTTLLDFIAGRLRGFGSKLDGGVYLNGQLLTEDIFREKGGYVIQADRLLPSLTVEETLTYTARLQTAGARYDASRGNIHERVQQILSDLGIRHVADSLVGGHLVRGISGGERRRVSIAVQMIQDPHVLLLDEPTTGLDSFTSHFLVQKLSDIAKKQNKIICMTIHQPRSDIFKIFDQIGLLSQGQVQYFGDREDLVPHFTSQGYPCPTYSNPLDYYIDLVSVDRRDEISELTTSQRLELLRQFYLKSDIYQRIQSADPKLRVAGEQCCVGDSVGLEVDSPHTRCGHGLVRSFRLIAILLSRMYLNLWRDHVGMVMRFVQLPIFASFLWIFLWRLTANFDTAIQDRSGLFYQSLAVPSMVGILSGASLFPSIRDLYYREAREGQYACHHMLIAYFIHIVPFHLVSSMAFAAWVYWGIGLVPGASQFAVFYGVVLAQQYLGELMMLSTLAVFQAAPLAQAAATLIVSFGVLIGSGLLKAPTSLISFLDWMSYAIYFKWSAAILVANEYHSLEFDCTPEQEPLCDIFTGDDYLDRMFPDAVENMARNAGILSGFVVTLAFLCFLIFKVKGIKQLN